MLRNNTLDHNFGTDPEVFIYKDSVDKLPNIIPPAALVEDFGQEYDIVEDKKVLLSGRHFQWSEDGAAIEAQISPSRTVRGFLKNYRLAVRGLKRYLREFDMDISSQPLGYFDTEEYWENRGEDFRMCVIFGCDPDMSPRLYRELGLEDWNEVGDEELDVSQHNYRYGGGHVHIQSPESDPEIYMPLWDVASIVFDFFGGLVNVSLNRSDNIIEQERKRLNYYGKPGRIRLQEYPDDKYGIEYRVMSNYWLNNATTVNKILNSMDIAANMVENYRGEEFLDVYHDRIGDMYTAITELDQELAKDILSDISGWLVENDICETERALMISK